MTENMKAFMDALKNNEELAKKFAEMTTTAQAEGKDCSAEFIALAKECGITLTAEDFKFDKEELSDEELENASGGYVFGQYGGDVGYGGVDVDYYTRIAIQALEGFGDDFADEVARLKGSLQH